MLPAVSVLMVGNENAEVVDVPAVVRRPQSLDSLEMVVSGHVRALLAQLESRLRVDKPALHRGLAPGAAHGGITMLEAELELELPRPLRLLLAWRDGLRDGALAGSLHLDYQLLGTRGIARAWRAHPELFRPSLVPFAASPQHEWLAMQTQDGPELVRGQVLRVRAGCADRDVRFRNLQAFLEVVLRNRGKFAATDDSRKAGMQMLAAARELGPSA